MSEAGGIGDRLIGALEEALAHARGELSEVREDRVQITARRSEVRPPPGFDRGRIRSVRERLRVSQAVFAELLNVSSATVRSWEQGVRTPEGASLRLLELADTNPEILLDRLRTRARGARHRGA